MIYEIIGYETEYRTNRVWYQVEASSEEEALQLINSGEIEPYAKKSVATEFDTLEVDSIQELEFTEDPEIFTLKGDS